jgi:hypothetical protein
MRSPNSVSQWQSLCFEVVPENLVPIRPYRTFEMHLFPAQSEDSISAVSTGLERYYFQAPTAFCRFVTIEMIGSERILNDSFLMSVCRRSP